MSDAATHSLPSRHGWVWPSIVTLIILGLLLGLGFWQLQRRTEKHALIAALKERVNAPPIPLPPASQWSGLRPDRDQFRRVTMSAVIDEAHQAQVYGAGSVLRKDVSGPGVWVFAPARLAGGETVVINRGYVSQGQRVEPDSVASPISLVGYIRFPEQPGVLTTHEDAGQRLWFVRDIASMAKAIGWGNVAPFYIDLESPTPPSGSPKPGPLQVQLPDDHVQYAITWFTLALAVVIGFVVWVRGQRRV